MRSAVQVCKTFNIYGAQATGSCSSIALYWWGSAPHLHTRRQQIGARQGKCERLDWDRLSAISTKLHRRAKSCSHNWAILEGSRWSWRPVYPNCFHISCWVYCLQFVRINKAYYQSETVNMQLVTKYKTSLCTKYSFFHFEQETFCQKWIDHDRNWRRQEL